MQNKPQPFAFLPPEPFDPDNREKDHGSQDINDLVRRYHGIWETAFNSIKSAWVLEGPIRLGVYKRLRKFPDSKDQAVYAAIDRACRSVYNLFHTKEDLYALVKAAKNPEERLRLMTNAFLRHIKYLPNIKNSEKKTINDNQTNLQKTIVDAMLQTEGNAPSNIMTITRQTLQATTLSEALLLMEPKPSIRVMQNTVGRARTLGKSVTKNDNGHKY